MKKNKKILSGIKNIFQEVKTMQWPTFKQWLKSTTFIIIFSVIIILLILVLDILFYQIRDKYIL
ncbi:MAG TPA: preprotein translocase subunit SecE [Candidatus Dojkabacteria bacterium]|nr:preprotein translocase subunit SecE [Candidatus Dojkabacteria bacterium]HQF36943.1 preprotein translocase subunit SecE [Candidatus Dojkabacteria bacterium]